MVDDILIKFQGLIFGALQVDTIGQEDTQIYICIKTTTPYTVQTQISSGKYKNNVCANVSKNNNLFHEGNH